jgi:hypothetical protein
MSRDWRGRAGALIVVWVACAAIETVLVGKIDAQETPVGLALAAIAAVAAVGALVAGGDRYAFGFSALAAFPRLVATVAREAVAVFGALLRVLAGNAPEDRLEEIAFDPGGDDARGAAVRALAIASASAGPNSIVVDVDRGRGVLLVHRLAR